MDVYMHLREHHSTGCKYVGKGMESAMVKASMRNGKHFMKEFPIINYTRLLYLKEWKPSTM